MDTITKALKQKCGMRVSYGWRWLVFDQDKNLFVVYEKKPYQRGSSIIIETESESVTVETLCEEEE